MHNGTRLKTQAAAWADASGCMSRCGRLRKPTQAVVWKGAYGGVKTILYKE